jgi:hypothetical protein
VQRRGGAVFTQTSCKAPWWLQAEWALLACQCLTWAAVVWHVSCATAQYPPRAYLIVNNNTEPSSATPFTGSGFTWRPSRPDYLPDLRNVVVPDSNKHNTSIIMDISQLPTRIFSYMVWDGMKSLFEAAMPTAMINYGEVHEVSVTSNHPWHLHIYNLMVSKH